MQGATVCGGATLTEPERDWRRVAGYITREFNKLRFTEAPVNYINYGRYSPYPEYASHADGAYTGEIDDGQGNGQGLSV